MDPLNYYDTPELDKSWFSPFSGVKADKAERATQFVNALIISTLLSENKIEQALDLMNQLNVRGKVMLLDIATNPLNNQLFSEVAKEVIFFNINTNIDNGHVSYSHASSVTDGQIANKYFGEYLPKLQLMIQLNKKVEKIDDQILQQIDKKFDKKVEIEIKDQKQQPNKIELLMLQQQEKKQKQLEVQKQISQEDIAKALIKSGSITCELLPKVAPKSFYEKIAEIICNSEAPELVVDNLLEGLNGIVKQLPYEYQDM